MYYRLCMSLNKVNLCWVLSEGRKGHEIQSIALAKCLSTDFSRHTFSLNPLLKALAPKMLPGFKNGFKWQDKKPDFQHPPNLIITTGRKAAVAGKYVAQKLRKHATRFKHIQILNPKDNYNNYDLLLLPKHDQISGSNIITFTGSIHPFNPQWFSDTKHSSIHQYPAPAVILGNPPKKYFKLQFATDLKNIRMLYPEQPIFFCGSPRLSGQVIDSIKSLFDSQDKFWFNDNDGPNPYQTLLQQAKHIFITADSINMLNECAGSHIPLTLLAQKHIQNPKHHRFIDSLANRWQGFEKQPCVSIAPIPYALDDVIKDAHFQKLLNSPTSFNNG